MENTKFKPYDLVETPEGRMAIQTVWSKTLQVDGSWLQSYICCPLNKDNKTIDFRKLHKRVNAIRYTFYENKLHPIKPDNQ